jgi:hypothetical protein
MGGVRYFGTDVRRRSDEGYNRSKSDTKFLELGLTHLILSGFPCYRRSGTCSGLPQLNSVVIKIGGFYLNATNG